ncbi:C5a anaphylatoxin chemotactic receptor 1-like [Hyla sarda]|uniref:C5a anaphylatoxin chemotactic receptor 1-like n=1 Tax=Hyla sarda TaxID=327740 RepID=UPI0024C330D4|nr:C5a anaphylatoxin chemotactic receptor 1-like [Hyla sarda]XP_056393953.1 C5a anaphylatoxin chemotactic receptor 1-like [Hyla sarda]XP_056393954.1 C5a anaphylatoxin chemotactic receptor 1-like [Hyla sarda]XP_056393955.1 C5a anaphylatoxin chemotactic receptor 1-like [Hyla sarda]XP_056393956.1 C5a anaphylatoxin chemotactic receptor 1-like [Hyla sarda]XP_056393957.1 C5a anaphylatoxin chemotactic receptor 1-like [Hyla sarda]
MESNDSYDYNSDYVTDIMALPTEPPEVMPPTTVFQWIALFLYILVVVLGIPGNTLVVWITAFDMKRTVNTIWFLNLAVADLLCCLSASLSIMTIALGYWPLGLFACKFNFSILLINMYASVILLTLISIDRCALVMKPVWCQNNRTLIKAYVACAVMWILAVILAMPSFIFRKIGIYYGKEHCTQDYSSVGHNNQQRVENAIAILRLLLGFIIPFLVIVTCYSILINRVKERFNQNTKTLKVVLVVILGFFICWLPYHVAGLILASEATDSDMFKSTLKVDPILIAIAFMNSCINPIIYVLMGQDFKSKFKKSFRSILKNVLTEDSSQTLDSKKKSISETRNTDTLV